MAHLDRVAFLFEMKAFSIRFVSLHLKMFLSLHPKSENQFRPSRGQGEVFDLKWTRMTFAWPFPMNQKIYDEYLFQTKLKSCPKSNFLLNPNYLKPFHETSGIRSPDGPSCQIYNWALWTIRNWPCPKRKRKVESEGWSKFLFPSKLIINGSDRSYFNLNIKWIFNSPIQESLCYRAIEVSIWYCLPKNRNKSDFSPQNNLNKKLDGNAAKSFVAYRSVSFDLSANNRVFDWNFCKSPMSIWSKRWKCDRIWSLSMIK